MVTPVRSGTFALGSSLGFRHEYTGDDVALARIVASRALTQRVWLGVEAVGSDLEGFFETDEAEGGATVLIGPTVALGVTDHWRLLLGGGPVVRATTNKPLPNETVSSLTTPIGQTGYALRMSLRRVW